MRGFLLDAWPALSVTFATFCISCQSLLTGQTDHAPNQSFEINHFVMISAVQALVVSKIEAASLVALFLKVTHTHTHNFKPCKQHQKCTHAMLLCDHSWCHSHLQTLTLLAMCQLHPQA